MVGRLWSTTPDSLKLWVADGNSVVAVDRRAVLRIERHRGVSLGNTIIAGCLAVGGALALAGSQVHDPDSPGGEVMFATLGFLVGCTLGGFAGAAIGFLGGHFGWEDITV